MKKILFFDVMITPNIITGIYWIGLLGVLVFALNMVASTGGGVIVKLIGVLISFVFGAILLRVWCELLIVIFKINENLQKVSDRS